MPIAVRPMMVVVTAALLAVSASPLRSDELTATIPAQQATVAPSGTDHQDSPQEHMRRRFPQPVRVSDLIGLRVLDDNDATIGRVLQVVRSPQGAILLIVSYGSWLGSRTRAVAVPIEVVGIFGHQLASLDMKPEEYATAATWPGTSGQILGSDETIQIALARR